MAISLTSREEARGGGGWCLGFRTSSSKFTFGGGNCRGFLRRCTTAGARAKLMILWFRVHD